MSAELLHEFKIEPMLAMDAIKLSNLSGVQATAQLLPAMSRLGEGRLRLHVQQHGLPSPDKRMKVSSARALRRGVAAQMLAAQTNVIHPDEAYTLGLLHDVGETLLLNLFPDEMLALEKFDETVRPQRQAELFGLDGAQISRWMLEACRAN